MQTATRNREPDPRSFAARRGHTQQLSISDDTHHVTEAIGYMYEDDGSPTSPHQGRNSYRSDAAVNGEGGVHRAANTRATMPGRQMSFGDPTGQPEILNALPLRSQNYEWDQAKGTNPGSPTIGRERSPSQTAIAHFPINNIDYESSPAAVQQELNNLQALRRMSMDIGASGDPDLPHLNTAAIPSAPSSASGDEDSARLFWVPARLHPELAPREFKTFLDSKAEQIKRRSGELSAFSPSPTSSRSNSLGSLDSSDGLKRKKSMLSRQINTSIGYQDGADRLERKRSKDQKGSPLEPNLEELESLVSADTDTERTSLEAKIDEETGDIILPSVPGSSLKRSTRTKYQRSNSKKGREERATYAQRAARRAAGGGRESPSTPTEPEMMSMPSFSTDVSNLASTLKDPNVASSPRSGPSINFSRPGDRGASPTAPIPSPTFDPTRRDGEGTYWSDATDLPESGPKRVLSPPTVGQSNERPIPQILETPPPEERPVRTSSMRPPNVYTIPASSSQTSEPSQPESYPQPPSPSKSSARPGMPSKQSSVTLTSTHRSSSKSPEPIIQTNATQGTELTSPISGNEPGASGPSNMPMPMVDKRPETRKKEEKKSGWSRLLGEKDSPKPKASKTPQVHDNTRLDVLQTSIDGGAKGRESLVLDRESLKLDDERKKDGGRKVSSSSEKKDKEGGFFSSLFGKKNKGDKEAQKKLQERLSPEPRSTILRADIDYNWTRFSILEERAIYRMAHIKLANPRRALYSQVLLSNFMYSYLAKVQQMHPQMNLPTSAKQQRKQKEQERQQQQQQQQSQPDEYTQYQRYQQQQSQHPPPQQQQHQYSPQQGYDDDASNYDQDHSDNGGYGQMPAQSSKQRSGPRNNGMGVNGNDRHGSGGGTSYSIVGGANSYYHQQQQQGQPRQNNHYNGGHDDDDDDQDMW